MAENNTIVTSYPNPDLDGTACVFAYAELLKKLGNEASPVIFGTPHIEAQFVFKRFNIPDLQKGDDVVNDDIKVIIVDSSDPGDMPKNIRLDQVIEIIDHRQVHQADKFPNAKVQIELVGSAATLIAEKFQKENISPSTQAAALMYSAIVSNTVNFQNDVTTAKDKAMAAWLKELADVPAGYVEEMFLSKSRIDESLLEVFMGDFKRGMLGSKSFAIAQLEIIGAEGFVTNRLQEIKETLAEIKDSENLDFVFLNCIEVNKAFNLLVAADDSTQQLLEKSLKVDFVDQIAKTERIIMRKQIIPLLKAL